MPISLRLPGAALRSSAADTTLTSRSAMVLAAFNAPQMRRDASLIRKALRTRPARTVSAVLIGFWVLVLLSHF